MERKIVYLINPISGTRGKTSVKEAIIKATEVRKISFEIISTNIEGDYAFLREKIINEKITDVVICGGDGSVNTVGSWLAGMDVNTGIIPMGSGNGLALGAGIPVAVRKALEIVFNGKASHVDGFYINEAFSCMLCGLGFDAQVAHDFAGQKKRGLATYVRICINNFFSSRPYPFTIKVGGQVISTHAYFISIANSNQFGNNFTIAPKASLNDGLLDIVVVRKMNKLFLPFTLLAQLGGLYKHQDMKKEIVRKNILYFQAGELTIVNEGCAPFHIDGEPVSADKELKIKIVRNALRLLQP